MQGSDLHILRHHVYNSTTDKNTLKLLVEKCLPLCSCPEVLTPPFSSSSQSSQAQTECNGHDVAISIDDMEKSMDIFGNCISTLLCYLEQEGYLEIKYVTTDKCTLKCSGGQSHLDALVDKDPIVKVAAEVNEVGGNGMFHNFLPCTVIIMKDQYRFICFRRKKWTNNILCQCCCRILEERSM